MRPGPAIAPSILAADFARLAEEVERVGEAEWLHVDVMDGHFVPEITVGLPVLESLRAATALPLDCHLMVDDPHGWAPRFAAAGARNVTFHAEATRDVVALAKLVHAEGSLVGLAIDRDTPVEPYFDALHHFDTLLIMTIKAGAGGQQFIPELLPKVRAAHNYVSAHGLSVAIEVDGGISARTIGAAAAVGADVFVAGTAIFGTDDPAAAVSRLRSAALRASAVGRRPDEDGAGAQPAS